MGVNKERVVGTGGELLMHQLVAQGVEYAFTNTGSAEAGFFDAFLTVPGVQPILLLNESLVLSAADGYARASRNPAFVNVHLAAGTRQGSGQLFNSHFDGFSPIIGGVPSVFAHFLASMTFVISGGVCVGSAREQAQRKGKSQSRRTPAKSPHRGFVMPTFAPRPGGVSLGLTGVF